MTPPVSLLERAVELDRSGSPYAMATVVAVRRPTSARPGARGLILPDGSIEGFVGGSCARPIVVREALRALADGQPRLLRISKEPPSESRRGDGIVDEVMTCHSGGTLEIYVEPHLPAAALWVAGTTPIAASLAELGASMGFDVTLIDPIADPSLLPAGLRVVVGDDLASLPKPAVGPYVVVASQGVWDEEAIASALRLDVAYVGLVASPTRAAAVRTWLLDEGIEPDRVLRDARAGRPRPRRRDGGRGRRVDPRRARPGPPRPRAVRRRARPGDARRRGRGRRARSTVRSSTTSSCSTRSVG